MKTRAYVKDLKDKMSESELRKYISSHSCITIINHWSTICCYQRLSEDFIREFKDKVVWKEICCYQDLSEDFIREFQDKVDWKVISERQKLSEAFIREFQDKVSWKNISWSYTFGVLENKLSEDFIREFKDKDAFLLSWGELLLPRESLEAIGEL